MKRCQRIVGICLKARRRSSGRIVFARGLGRVRGDEGGSLVEFALVVPLMMILITGMFSLAMALNNYMVLTNAVGAGARAFAVSPSVTVANGSGTPTALTDPCQYAIQIANQAALGLSQGITYTITYTPVGGSATTLSSSCPSVTPNLGDTIQLKATYSPTLVWYGVKPKTLNLTAQTAELVQ